MYPLLITGRVCKAIDEILSYFDPFTCSDLGANGRLKFAEVAKDTHSGSCCVYYLRQIFISGTMAGMNSSASVTAITSATVTPGAVSCNVIFPPGKAITAISVTTRSTNRKDVRGRAHFCTILDFPFAACCMATLTRLAPLT